MGRKAIFAAVAGLVFTVLWIGFSVIYGLRMEVAIGGYIGVAIIVYLFIYLQNIRRLRSALESIANSNDNP